ncbi:type II toxin-antitoxin system HicB family antitoxin [bacterium]|nr:type II toxin-antitoxin system HicB family antitoxin [bacterium]
MKDYHINIFYSDDDGGYIADIPDLPMCSAFGSSPTTALREAQKAKRAWLAAAKELGKTLPEPRYKPVWYQLAHA